VVRLRLAGKAADRHSYLKQVIDVVAGRWVNDDKILELKRRGFWSQIVDVVAGDWMGRASYDAYRNDRSKLKHKAVSGPSTLPGHRKSTEERSVRVEGTVSIGASTSSSDDRSTVFIYPMQYVDARNVGEAFRSGASVVMDLSKLPESDAKRLIDFAAGLTFGARGTFKRLGNRTYRLTPGVGPDLRHERTDRLSLREASVARLWVQQGYTVARIAAELGLSRHTVNFHLRNIYRKFGVARREELVSVLTRPGAASVSETPGVHPVVDASQFTE
jgi:FtsZ-interacting cell division protein YlmF